MWWWIRAFDGAGGADFVKGVSRGVLAVGLERDVKIDCHVLPNRFL